MTAASPSLWTHFRRSRLSLLVLLCLAAVAPGQDEADIGAGREVDGVAEPMATTKQEFKTYADRIFKKTIAPHLAANCYKCHGNKKVVAELNLEKLKPDFLTEQTADVWRLVYERTRDLEMPPTLEMAVNRPPQLTEGIAFKLSLEEETEAFAEALGQVIRRARLWRDPQPDIPVFKPKESDDKLTRLLKQRHSAAREAALAFHQEVEAGHGTASEQYLKVMQRITLTEVELAKTTAEEMLACKRLLAFIREHEDLAWDRHRAGAVPHYSFSQIKAERLGVQIQLQRALQKTKHAK